MASTTIVTSPSWLQHRMQRNLQQSSRQGWLEPLRAAKARELLQALRESEDNAGNNTAKPSHSDRQARSDSNNRDKRHDILVKRAKNTWQRCSKKNVGGLHRCRQRLCR